MAFDALTVETVEDGTFFDFIVDLVANTFRMVGESIGLPIDETRTLGLSPIITMEDLKVFINAVSFDAVLAIVLSPEIGALPTTRLEDQTTTINFEGPTEGVITAI